MENRLIGEYIICRTYSAGVFAGILHERNGKEVFLLDARRLWYWRGAASLSQLATKGTSLPLECKFPEKVESVLLQDAIELIKCSDAGRQSIEGVPIWQM